MGSISIGSAGMWRRRRRDALASFIFPTLCGPPLRASQPLVVWGACTRGLHLLGCTRRIILTGEGVGLCAVRGLVMWSGVAESKGEVGRLPEAPAGSAPRSLRCS